MLQDPQVLGNDHNKPHSLMSDPISTVYFNNMSCDLSNKILFKPRTINDGILAGRRRCSTFEFRYLRKKVSIIDIFKIEEKNNICFYKSYKNFALAILRPASDI